ncbi:hypothetical protein CRE_23414 [Caenorhabditis remanei]|uniref:DUF38 domain-containing protein n=1 Tax=Caenorhabditis remanei TaxID=31234 RepID=E3MGN6_CAERE|nr:hypothetical protein CRE_23414 [Caenorhabditis remanei]
MEKIMNYLDFIAIQSVRKTCWGLRNFIDDKKPGIGMKRIRISQMSDTLVRLMIILPSSERPEGTYIDLRYEKHENGRSISCETSDGFKAKFVENLNFLDAALHDFKIAINSQKLLFEEVTVSENRFFEKFEEMMKSQKPFATESMKIHADSLEHARQILQHADPKYLKTIDINLHKPNNITETVKFESSENIQNFSHFATASIQFENLNVDALRAIKEVCLFVQMSIYIKFFQNFLQFHEYNKYLFVIEAVRENLFIDAFGAACKQLGEKREIWFFNVPGNKEKVLQVYNDFIYFEYRFVEKCEVAEDYVILN